MQSNDRGDGFVRQAGRFVRPLAAAVWRGTADPREVRGWPVPLRERWPFRRVGPATAALAVDALATLVILSTTSVYLIDEMPERSDNWLITGAAAMSLPLALRHWHPLGAWRLSFAAMTWVHLQNWSPGTPYVPGGAIVFLVICYSVAVRCERHITVGVGVLSILAAWAYAEQSAFVAGVLILVPLLAGYNVRVRRVGRRELEEREELHREERAVLAERQRIAREMHDVVAHHMSVIAIQAEAAPYRVPDPDPVLARSFADIRTNALAGLADLRRILGVLREEGASPLTAPQPGLERVDELIENARGTGLRVTARIARPDGGLPPAVGLAAYRIVQEALSNALRHAPGAVVRVVVAAEAGVLRLSVANGPPSRTEGADGGAASEAVGGAGHGILGMRERAATLGGAFEAGATPEGGFAVVASLPLATGDP